jgi:hypothetical protein
MKIYKIILLLVLYGCETWSPTELEGHRLSGLENGVLRNIFGPKREEVTGRLRKFSAYKEKLHNLYCSLLG